ncbi:MAG TPA: TipAS antibiotic-recognition domain-containing protein [Thermoleophilia bacterium]|nr:TipAS antibiotic-recognition domain-containing protein [Thermoleophilia bacterium]
MFLQQATPCQIHCTGRRRPLDPHGASWSTLGASDLCSRKIHAELGEICVSDPRFTATYEKTRPGMATCTRAATAANAAHGET